MTIPFVHLLQETFAKHASRPAWVYGTRKDTFADIAELARTGAALLQQKYGIRMGDRVALCASNKRLFLLSYLATLLAGAVPLPLNPRFTREELRFFLTDSGAHLAIADAQSKSVVESLQSDMPNLRVIQDLEIQDLPAAAYAPRQLEAIDPCLMLYSSGTTGWPKGVVHTHGNVASALLALQKCWRLTPEDVVLNVLPLFHIHGLCFASLLTLLSGGCLVLDEFDPQRTMAQIRDCTVFMAVPTIYYRFLEQPNFREVAKTWTKTRLFTCGSAPIRAEVLPDLEAILGKPVINRYGMSEAFVITSLPLDGPWPNGSVGLPLDGIEVRVVREGEAPAEPRTASEPDAPTAWQEPRPPDQVGAVQIRGPNLFREYWRKADATRDAPSPPAPLPEGEGRNAWFDTGDLGFLDDVGFLTLVGRKNDLIITSGFNVYPQVVERVINACPGVRESAVLGVPDERKGERVVAVVVREDATLDEVRLRAFWSERLVDYQRPKDIVFVEALPRNAMGKVLRRELQLLFGERGA